MKMAKASTADIEMALELSRFVEDLVDGICPKQAMEKPESEGTEWLEDDPDDQHIKIIAALTAIARKGSIFRVTFGMSVLLDPRNELVDPDAETLEPHPKFNRAAAINDELISALNAMLTHMGMDEDEWNKPTFDQAREAIAKAAEVKL